MAPCEEIIAVVDSDDYTLGEIISMVNRYKKDYPDFDIFLDGDRKAIVGKRKTNYIQTTLEN